MSPYKAATSQLTPRRKRNHVNPDESNKWRWTACCSWLENAFQDCHKLVQRENGSFWKQGTSAPCSSERMMEMCGNIQHSFIYKALYITTKTKVLNRIYVLFRHGAGIPQKRGGNILCPALSIFIRELAETWSWQRQTASCEHWRHLVSPQE